MDGHGHDADAIGSTRNRCWRGPARITELTNSRCEGLGLSQMNVLSRFGSPRVGVAQVVLHISDSFGEIFGPFFFKFREDLVV